MGQRPGAVVPYLLPKLCARPISLAHARALAAVAEVAGAALHLHLDTVLPAVLGETYLEAELCPAGTEPDVELRDALVNAALAVGLAVEDDGMHYLTSELRIATGPKSKPHVRVAGASLIGALCKQCTLDLSSYLPSFMQSLVGMFAAAEPPVLRAGLAGLDAIVKSQPKERYPLHITLLRDGVQEVADEHRKAQLALGAPRDEQSLLPALCLPSGIGPLVAVYLQGLMTGTPELRETSAAALGEAVALTSAPSLKPFVISITGPLIRIVGDRFPWGVKAAILKTLTLLIVKGSILLKPFVPQLQTTFVKSLADPTKLVRDRGALALSKLISLATRTDPLATELHASLASADAGVQAALLCALAGVVRGVKKELPEALLGKIQAAGLE